MENSFRGKDFANEKMPNKYFEDVMETKYLIIDFFKRETFSQKLQDLLKMSRLRRKAYRKGNTTCEWDDGGKTGKNNSN